MIINEQERDYIIHDENNVKGFFAEYRFLSNFHQCTVYFEGMCFNSSEAAYMAAKTDNTDIRKQISLMSPKEAKFFSRTMDIKEGWSDMKFDVMSVILFDKFYRNDDLRKLLLATGDKYLEESNHWKDVFWGCCEGKGKNNLGKILIGIREFWKIKEPKIKETKNLEDIQTKLF